jgi:hypothetical protein
MAAFPRPTACAVGLIMLLSACSATGRTTASDPTRSVSPVAPTTSPSSGRPAVDGAVMAPGDPRYRVSLRADPGATVWHGSQEVTFTNTADTPLARIWLRAWGNGIAGCDPLAIELTGVTGGTLGAARRSCTALPIDLPSPLEPGDRAAVGFDLTITVPARNDRFGHHLGIALLGNALPTLAVRDAAGWHLDPYVDLGESFFSLVGRYRVALDVPSGLSTPTTGSLVALSDQGERETRTFVARDVRDFAWAAGRFDVAKATTADGVRVRVWYPPSFMTASRAALTLRDSLRAMTTYAEAFGPYPYPGVEVVVAAFTSFLGMEYPRIVFANPERRVLAHELAHQWWYAIVGNDQFSEPWLDESFATWTSMLPWGPWTRCPAYDWPSEGTRLTNDMGYWAEHRDEYATVYEGGGCMLANLAGRFGLHRFVTLLAGYAGEHWLGVATTEAFQAQVERAASRLLEGFDAEAYWQTWRVG